MPTRSLSPLFFNYLTAQDRPSMLQNANGRAWCVFLPGCGFALRAMPCTVSFLLQWADPLTLLVFDCHCLPSGCQNLFTGQFPDGQAGATRNIPNNRTGWNNCAEKRRQSHQDNDFVTVPRGAARFVLGVNRMSLRFRARSRTVICHCMNACCARLETQAPYHQGTHTVPPLAGIMQSVAGSRLVWT